jgi:hypothetical protein
LFHPLFQTLLQAKALLQVFQPLLQALQPLYQPILQPLLQPLPSAATTEHTNMLQCCAATPLQLNIKFLVLRAKEEKKI